MSEEKEPIEFWTGGRIGTAACIRGWQQGNASVMSAEVEALTRNQFERAVQRQYPDHVFTFKRVGDCWKAQR